MMMIPVSLFERSLLIFIQINSRLHPVESTHRGLSAKKTVSANLKFNNTHTAHCIVKSLRLLDVVDVEKKKGRSPSADVAVVVGLVLVQSSISIDV